MRLLNLRSVATVKHGGGSIMLWGCFTTSVPGLFFKAGELVRTNSYLQ